MDDDYFFLYLPEEKHFTPGVRFLARGRQIPTSGSYSHPYWVLELSYEGGESVKVNQGKFRVREPGEAYLYPPNTPYVENSDAMPSRPRDIAFIVFTGGVELGLEYLVVNPAGYAVIRDAGGRLALLFDRLGADCRSAGAEAWMAANAILYEMAMLLRSLVNGPAPWKKRLAPNLPGVSPRIWADAVKGHLRTSLNGSLSLAKLAQLMHCSVSTLTHEYRAIAGETVWTTLMRFRVEAVQTLLSSGRPLAEIARMTGFGSEFHLSRVFRKVTGAPPRGKPRK